MKTYNFNRFAALLFYLVFFLLLFLQFPIHNSLPGNCDTWLGIALTNAYPNEIWAIVSGADIGTSMFPASDIHQYGETAPGSAAHFLLMKLMGLNDIWAQYGYLASLFALTAFGVFLLVNYLTRNYACSLFSGFAFSCSNFMFANIDDPIVLFYFFPCIALLYLMKAIQSGEKKHLYVASIVGGLQVYFSIYVFAYQSIALLTVVLFNWRLLARHYTWRPFLQAVSLYLAMVIPSATYYFFVLHYTDISGFNPTGNELNHFRQFSLELSDLVSVIPGNLLYESNWPAKTNHEYWIFLRTRVFVGYFVLVLAFFALFTKERKYWPFIWVGIIGLLLSWGGTFKGNSIMHPPSYYIYNFFPPMIYFRIILRSYFLTSFAIAILAGVGLAHIFRMMRIKSGRVLKIVIVLMVTVHALENIPVPMPAYAGDQYYKASEAYLNYFSDKSGNTVVDLPSNKSFLTFVDMDKSLNSYNREFIYMNWQTQHKQNTVNGLNGYFPASRLEIQSHMDLLPERRAIQALIEVGVDHIVFHKNLVLPGEEGLLDKISSSEHLLEVSNSVETSIFKIRSRY